MNEVPEIGGEIDVSDQPIGRGRYGTVYRGKYEGRDCAVKVYCRHICFNANNIFTPKKTYANKKIVYQNMNFYAKK